jgi:DNA-binding response OmpR family regulator
LWGRQPHKTSRVVDMHISALRRKLSLLFPCRKDERFIYSAKGRGYMLI